MKNAEALRQERLRRLAKTAGKSKPVTASAPVAAKKPVAPVAQKTPVVADAAPVVVVPEVLTATVADPATLSRTASFDLSLYGEGTTNPHWLVVANGTPVAKIEYADQDGSLLPQDLFESSKYADAAVRAMSHEEPAKVLASLKARTFIATIEKSVAAEGMKREIAASADEQVRLARAELRDTMLNVLGLVVTAQTKNFLASNDLKAQLFDEFASLGVSEDTATRAIEAGWSKAAPSYFTACFKQAEEWMDLPAEAYKAIEKAIDGAQTRVVEPVMSADAVASVYAPVAVTASAAHVSADFESVFRR